MSWTKYKCQLCNFEGYQSKLKSHVESKHNLSINDYAWKYIFHKSGSPVCKTCGKPLKFVRLDRFSEYCNEQCWFKSDELKVFSSAKITKQWTDPKFQESVKISNSNKFKKLWSQGIFNNKSELLKCKHHDPNFVYNKLKSLGVNLDKPGVVYLVKYTDKCKVGFSTDLKVRLGYLGRPELINYVEFINSFDAIKFELSIHEKYSKASLFDGSKDSTEMYPLEYLNEFNNLIESVK